MRVIHCNGNQDNTDLEAGRLSIARMEKTKTEVMEVVVIKNEGRWPGQNWRTCRFLNISTNGENWVLPRGRGRAGERLCRRSDCAAVRLKVVRP